MECVDCGSAATSERWDRTAQGYRRFRCRDCGREFNERSGGLLNRTQYPSDVIALVVLWRLQPTGARPPRRERLALIAFGVDIGYPYCALGGAPSWTQRHLTRGLVRLRC